MKLELNGKEYNLHFDNWALHEYGEACGFETLEQTFMSFANYAMISESGGLTIQASKQLAQLVKVTVEEIKEAREALNLMYEHPELITSVLNVAIAALPKPKSLEGEEQKKSEV